MPILAHAVKCSANRMFREPARKDEIRYNNLSFAAYMRFSLFMTWVLGALLLMAALDTRPDPPSLTPCPACKVAQMHDGCWDAVTLRQAGAAAQPLFPVSLFAAEPCDGQSPREQIVLTGQAADPSPPMRS